MYEGEDEDAPSPLTCRISTLNFFRRRPSCQVVHRRCYLLEGLGGRIRLRGARVPVLCWTERGGGMRNDKEWEDGEEDRTLEKSGEWAQRQRQMSEASSTAPPTSWSGRNISNSITCSRGGYGGSARTSSSSVG
ncbi:hypothetical protein BDN70DRAFT_362548 [Pholiota conissans]|uniref:Uncharacterized protein n=1 Tax=Pholiota conissans TaxID=109636 RepID=A0A9P5YS29_9AGAR|nr:hypothetical protein BDN70DRAFT_362548 [Pholiota conissans]